MLERMGRDGVSASFVAPKIMGPAPMPVTVRGRFRYCSHPRAVVHLIGPVQAEEIIQKYASGEHCSNVYHSRR